MSELKPCPWPSCRGTLIDVAFSGDAAWAECRTCTSRGPTTSTIDQAVKEWNALPRFTQDELVAISHFADVSECWRCDVNVECKWNGKEARPFLDGDGTCDIVADKARAILEGHDG